MLALVLAAALAQVDAGVPNQTFDAPVYGACPVTTEKAVRIRDLPADVPVTSFLLPDSQLVPTHRAQRSACLLETCEAHRALLEAEVKKEQDLIAFKTGLTIGGAVTAAGLGFLLAVELVKHGVLKP